jgi:hypothetical protein
VLLKQGEDRLKIGGLTNAATSSLVGVAAAELHLVGAGDPVQQPAGILNP